ncbi:15333_t:CDS:10 [Acaulospora colombiana]|uniref:15333_t:CDS:1 n=1 Tax=Acaulospora colombiana TaxID=27376 RepID=A0ACA9K017_9GLOM|nr:15333_t:CDS:10 [Acaulospora colombiana]
MGSDLFEVLSKDLGEYLGSGYGCDVKIHVGEYDQRTYDVHSVILAARSPYFRRKINDTPLNPGRVMEFYEQDISPTVPLHNVETDNLLDVLMSTNEPFLTDDPTLVVDFVLAADELELSELVRYLQNILINDRTEWLCENIDNIYPRIFKRQSLRILKDFYKNIIETDVELMLQLGNISKMPLNDVILMASRDDLLMDETEIPNIGQPSNALPSMEKKRKLTAIFTKSLDELYQDLVRYHVNPDRKPESFNLPKRVGKIESNLISIKHVSLISQWIKDQQASSLWQKVRPTKKTAQYRYNLLTRGSQGGFSRADFLEACQHKGPTIILIRLEGSDLIVGGYNPTPWVTSLKPNARARKSFIFAFDNDRDDPKEVGRICKLGSSKTCPVVSITDKSLKFGKDLSLNFTDSYDQPSVLRYQNVEYTLLDNLQRQMIENPANIKDFEEYPTGRREVVVKLLSVDPQNYPDAPREGIRRILEIFTGKPHPRDKPVDTSSIESIRMGTTVATNALLERKGEKCALLITKGFKDLLVIGNQARPKIFELAIRKPDVLYQKVVEVDERVSLIEEISGDDSDDVLRGISGECVKILQRPDLDKVKEDMQSLYAEGFRSIAICLMHSYTYPDHERQLGELATEIGFTHISLSSSIMPMIKIVPRGNSSTADAYLTPCIRKYINGFISGFDENLKKNVRLEFMQSDGGLVPVNKFSGFRAILSGPAAGVVGYALTSYSKEDLIPVIGFDMGGTSTDVSRFDGRYEHVFETTTAGVSIQAPQLDIHTVAAGGGSRLFFRNGMFVVGPESASAHPGPTCYRKDGPLTVTDANLILGRLNPDYFPKIFGPNEDQPLDIGATRSEFEKLSKEINAFNSENKEMNIDEIAFGFIKVANEAMCRPIRALTEAKGYDTSKHILACFGGAGGQHACAIAQNLGIGKILIHRYGSILSAYGLALANVVHEVQEPCSKVYSDDSLAYLKERIQALREACTEELKSQGFELSQIKHEVYLNLRYQGTDFALMTLEPKDSWNFIQSFVEQYQQEFGFTLPDRDIIVDDIRVRGIGEGHDISWNNVFEEEQRINHTPVDVSQRDNNVSIYFEGGRRQTPIYLLDKLQVGNKISGPALIIDANSTILVAPSCNALITTSHIIITVGEGARPEITAELDPIQLSIFGHRFMSIAEQMGNTLQKTSVSTNIKERLDFSCALFGADGGLVANAPHLPVHLGSLSHAVIYQINFYNGGALEDGDVIMTNHPKADITIITPVFNEGKIVFFVASRGHHADIGGSLPGSMPPHSKELYQEDAAIKSFKIVSGGKFDIDGLTDILLHQPARYPGCSGTRCLRDNISDLKAQVAANHKGITLVKALIRECGLDVVQAYMMHIRKNAELSVRELLKDVRRKIGSNVLKAMDYMDDGTPIKLQITIDEKEGSAVFDFAGTGPEVYGNTNAPSSVTFSAIIYCLRSLIANDIPLNQGCLTPIDIRIPEKSFLNPSDRAAVVGGNVLTSQRLVDTILKAFQACAASQGDCNNLTFGKDEIFVDGKKVKDGWGYYETIAGGSGAGPTWDGQSGVHVHMTNTRITDPEILERRLNHAVLLREFSLRKGSGGKGLHRGGDGVIRDLEFRESIQVSILSERRVYHPYGLNGGKDGSRGLNLWIRKNDGANQEEESGERILNLGGKNTFQVGIGDRVIICTPGGGGWGVVADGDEDDPDEAVTRFL